MRKIILDKGQSPGDVLVFTSAVRDLKKAFPDWQIDVRSNCIDFFNNNPYTTPLKATEPGVEYFDVGYDDIHNSGPSGRHFSNAYNLQLKKLLGVDFPQTSMLPDIHISDEEKGWTNQVEDIFGYKGKFWILAPGNKDDYPLKQWGSDRWQKAVNLLKDRIQFVQVGEKCTTHSHPLVDNVISLVGETSLRQLIRLFYHAEGVVCHVSLPMHLAAAFQKPCVVIAGGREPRRWEMYPNHRYLDTNGLLKCCAYNGCWKSGRQEPTANKKCVAWVGNETKCMAMIKPERVAEEILAHYEGGIL